MTLCATGLAVVAVADYAWSSPQASWLGAVQVLGLGVLTGLLIGWIAVALARLTIRVPLWVTFLAWVPAALVPSLWLLIELNVRERLEGRYRYLALGALAAAVALSIAIVAGGLLLQPRPRFPHGWLLHRPRLARYCLSAALIALGFAAGWAGRHVLMGQYQAAHILLCWVSLASFIVAAHLATIHVPGLPQRVTRGAWGLAAVLCLVPLLTLRHDTRANLSSIFEAPFPRLILITLRNISDVDRDGFSSLFGGGDCAPFNPAVHPAAREIPGNGIDDNCRFGDGQPPEPPLDPNEVPIPEGPSPASVVLITVDALRADRMSIHGAQRDTTPNLERFAKEAVQFNRAHAVAGYTSLALSSMFRGVYPRRLHWTPLYETSRFRLVRAPYDEKLNPGERLLWLYTLPLDDPRPSLVWWLQRRGMDTAAVVNDGFSEFLKPDLEIAGRFDQYVVVDELPRTRRKRGDADVTLTAQEMLSKFGTNEPFFLWLHYFAPHDPPEWHPQTKRYGTTPLDLYDHEVRYVDKQIGLVLEELRKRPDYDKIAIMITADHGEEVREGRRFHGPSLLEEVQRIPLLMKAPGVEPSQSDVIVSQVDVMPTILGLTKTPAPPGLDGVDLRELLENPPQERTVLFESWGYRHNGQVINDLVVAIDDRYRFSWAVLDQNRQVFDHHHETTGPQPNVIEQAPATHLEEHLGRYLESNDIRIVK